MKSSGAIILRLTHTGVYADGRPNKGSVTLYDLDESSISKDRARYVPIPVNSTVDVLMSTRAFISWSQGSIHTFVKQGLLTAEILFQLRDKQHFGGPSGAGQGLRQGAPNAERVSGVLRLVIPDNQAPTNLGSLGFLRGETLEIRGLGGDFQGLDGEYEIFSVSPGEGLAGPASGSYLLEISSSGPDLPPATLAGVTLRLTEGRVVVEFSSGGDVGGLGPSTFGYVGGQSFPGLPGGAAPHGDTHISGGLDEIEADLLNISYLPSNYARSPSAPSTLPEELTSHLAGIDSALGAVGGGGQDSFLTYNGQGQLEAVSYPDLTVKTLTYNGQGQLETVTYLGVTKTLNYNLNGTLASVILS